MRAAEMSVIGQAIPARKHNNRHIRRKETQCILHCGHAFVIARDVANRTIARLKFTQNQLRIIAFGRTGNGDV
jgi:hypothetical protein